MTASGPPVAGRLATNTAWNAADLIVSTITAIASSVIVARALGPTILGRYQFILWAAAIVSVLTMYGLPVTANRFVARYLATGRHDLAGTVVARTIRYQLLFALLALAAGLVFALTRAPAERPVIALVFISLAPALLMAVPTGVNSIDERFARNVIPSMIAEIAGTLGILVVALRGGGLLELAAVMLGTRTLDAVLRYGMGWSRLRELLRDRAPAMPDGDRREFREMIWQSVATQLLLFVVWDRSEIIFLELLSTPAQLAFFSVSFGLVARLRMIPNALVRAQTPRILKQYALSPDVARGATIAAMRQQLVLAIPGYALAVLFAGDAVLLLYGQEYLGAVPVMMVMAALSLPSAVARPIEALLTAVDGRRSILRLTAIAAGLAIGLDYALIAWRDAVGAGAANGLVSLSQALLLGLFATRVAGLRFAAFRPWSLVLLGTAAAIVARLATLTLAPLPSLMVGGAVALAIYAGGLWRGSFLSAWEKTRLAETFREARQTLSTTLIR